MPKINSKSFQFVKLVLLMLCVFIVLTVITFGLVILWSLKWKESTPKEKYVESILTFIKNFYFLSKDFGFKLNTK
jgi:flagellar basal body-associated protein FliL